MCAIVYNNNCLNNIYTLYSKNYILGKNIDINSMKFITTR